MTRVWQIAWVAGLAALTALPAVAQNRAPGVDLTVTGFGAFRLEYLAAASPSASPAPTAGILGPLLDPRAPVVAPTVGAPDLHVALDRRVDTDPAAANTVLDLPHEPAATAAGPGLGAAFTTNGVTFGG